MGNVPFLTIGIASYNYARYLEKAFAQIKKQGFQDFELLYCDDGSTDESVAVIEKIISENPGMNIRLIKGENEGLLANKNRIVEHAKGKYLLICDADDYMADDCLEKLCRAAQNVDADCVIGGFGETDDQGSVYKIHVPEENANKWIFIWHHAQIYRMDLVRAHSLKFTKVPDDVCFLQKIHLYANKTVFVPENLYYWVRHADSTSRDFSENADWHPRKLWCNIVDCMLEIGKEVSDERELWQIRYFLYKWFYFNVTDQPIGKTDVLKENIKMLQADMRRICPNYRKWSFVGHALRQQDTLFARIAVFVCWILEGLGCIKLLPIIRNRQQSMRG